MIQSHIEYDIFTLSNKHSKQYLLDVELNDVPVQMSLDTDATLSIITESTYSDISKTSAPQPLHSKLHTYNGHEIEVLGIIELKVRYENNVCPCSKREWS